MTDLNALSKEQLIAMLAQVQAQAQAPRKITYKVGEKGGISIYGLGRFPVTAYVSQWERIIADIDNLKAFIVANEKLLVRKPI